MMLSKFFCENWRKLHFLVQSTEPLTVTEVHPNSKVTLFRGIFGQNLEKYRHRAVVRHRLPRPDDNRMATKEKEGSVTEKVKQFVLLQFSPGKA
jgi:hypothetical protein